MHNYFLKNIYFSSFIWGCISPVISFMILFVLDGIFTIHVEKFSSFTFLELILVLIIAPIMETMFLIIGLLILELFLPILLSSIIVLCFFSYIHYFNHWAASITVIPIFFISIKLFVKWRKINSHQAIFGVIIIHFINNLIVVVLDFLSI